LIEHHEGDLRCPIGQGDEVFQTLKLLGKEAEYLRYPGGSHEGGPPSQNVDYMRRQIAWFDFHGGRTRAERASRNRARAAKAAVSV
jgi:dipeptidyl aminopeptidase/acylaminoacyl peptidase